MTDRLDPLVLRVLDGDLPLEELPPALRAEAEAARRVFGTADRAPVALSPGFDARVMAAVRSRGVRRGAVRRAVAWLGAPREVRVVVRPWMAGVLAAAAALVVLVARPEAPATGGVSVRFVLQAPEAQTVALAGTFNQWDSEVTPLVRSDGGLWTATLVLPAGEHEYAFVVDGERWVPDPAAPGVDDGFGRRNSVLTLSDAGRSM